MKFKMYNNKNQKYDIAFNKGSILHLVTDMWNRGYKLEKIAVDMNYSDNFLEDNTLNVWIYDGKDYDEVKGFDNFGAFIVYPNRAKSVEHLIDSIYCTIRGMGMILVNT